MLNYTRTDNDDVVITSWQGKYISLKSLSFISSFIADFLFFFTFLRHRYRKLYTQFHNDPITQRHLTVISSSSRLLSFTTFLFSNRDIILNILFGFHRFLGNWYIITIFFFSMLDFFGRLRFAIVVFGRGVFLVAFLMVYTLLYKESGIMQEY